MNIFRKVLPGVLTLLLVSASAAAHAQNKVVKFVQVAATGVAALHLHPGTVPAWKMPEKFDPHNVHEFIAKLAAGSGASTDMLQRELAEHPALARDMGRWLRAPEDKRAIVLSAQEDDARVRALRTELARSGLESFNYLDCKRLLNKLCHEEFIGAVLARSGQVVVVDTPHAVASPYVNAEVNMAQVWARYSANPRPQ